MNRSPDRRRGQFTLVLLVLLFGLPPLAGWLFYVNPQWLPDGRKNHGVLISPPRPLTSLPLQENDNTPFDWNSLKGHWTLVYHNRGTCDAPCQAQLQRLQQIRRAVGGERFRIQRLLIQEGPTLSSNSTAEVQQGTGTRVLYLDPSQHTAFEQLFTIPGRDAEPATYLVDPNGMLMMAHGHEQPAKEILQDLEFLLKASRNWI
ncbi:MAG: hypothetical protein OQL28_00690 [Sedimenticola sp.]|nr:hypothetical protein [Sedimenticola sp.]